MRILVKDALLDGKPCSLLLEEGKISWIRDSAEEHPRREIAPAIPGPDPVPDTPRGTDSDVDRVLDARGLHAFPSFRNAHTHVAMVLFRGYGDDMPLMDWLRTRIWPAEARLTAEDVYHGARLGIVEMIRSGTTFFNEMYWHRDAIERAVQELGVRAVLGGILLDLGDPEALEAQQEELEHLARNAPRTGRVKVALAPHSIYMVPPHVLERVGELARKHDLLVHIHLSETEDEVRTCLEANGCRPAIHLQRTGLLGPHLVAAHGQFLDDSELELFGEAGATIVTNPTANLKLATGGIFPYAAARRAGVRVCLGTDGAASNNNLDLVEEMKMAALVQKHREADATVLPAEEALALATSNPAGLFESASGTLAPGEPADLVLADFSSPGTQPVHDPISTLVYAASGRCVRTTICGGRVLMHEGRIEVCDESEVVAEAVKVARRVTQPERS